MSQSMYWVNAFTTEKFTGNPAVVVPNASDFSDEQMQAIAREMNCSETAFVLRPTDTEADLRLRWFTPTQEVPLCGHATVAALHILAELGQYNLKPGFKQILYVETLTGVLSITIDYTQPGAPWIWLTLPNCEFSPISSDLTSQVQSALAAVQVKAMVMDSLNHDVLIHLTNLQDLQQIKPDFELLKTLGQQHNWRGYSMFTTETALPENDAHLRFFAPQSGILEDPVTGSASGPLALYLKQQGLITGDRLIFEQGHSLKRPGHIHVDLSEVSPRCGGQAITVLSGTLND